MQIEYEVTFLNIDKDEIRKKLLNINAKLIKKRVFAEENGF
jgi:hypothetical protein